MFVNPSGNAKNKEIIETHLMKQSNNICSDDGSKS